ncbi:MAG TPA: hypothetical protein VN833_04285 [Candidatus Acidoferrales bacterium]|nr:hypothetical protein [Candidatus Acidoferrales bacterium]
MEYMPHANWEALGLIIIAWFWLGHRAEKKLSLLQDAQTKLEEQLTDANEKLQLFEYCIQEEKIAKEYNLSDDLHPEMYTKEQTPFGYKSPTGWVVHFKPKPELEKQIDLSRQVFVAQMIALQEKYKGVLQPGTHTMFTDENFWLWFEPAYKHPYYYVSRFVKTGKNNWVPPDLS